MTALLSPDSFFSLDSFQHRDVFLECSFVWEALNKLPSYFARVSLGQVRVKLPPSVHLVNEQQIFIDEDVLIEPGVFIQGPCIIGKGCQIRQGAYLRGGILLGKECVVGHTTELKNVIFLDHAKAAHFNYVGDSILGNHVNLGAGAKCANLRLDGQSITVRVEGKKLSTGLKKLGSILGDHVQIGCNAVLNPGTFVGKKGGCYPLQSIHGYISEGTIIKR